MKPNKSLIIILLILILDCSFFYSQLSGAELGKSKNGYISSFSIGKARQFSDVPAAGGSWGVNLALGKNLYYENDEMLSFDLMGNLFYIKTKGLDFKIYDFVGANEVLKNSEYNTTEYNTFFMNHKTSIMGLGIDGKLTFNKFREEQNWYGALLLGANWGLYTTKMDMKDAVGKSYAASFDAIKNLKETEKEKELKKIFDGKYETKAEDFGLIALKSTLMPSVGLEFGYDITDYLTVFVANKLYLGASNKIDGEIHIDDNKDKLNYLNLGLNVYFGKKSRVLPRIKDYESVPSRMPDTGYKIPKEVEAHNLPEVKILYPEERSFTSETKQINVRAKIVNITSALDVYCKVNDDKVNFDFSTNFVSFIADLRNGENKIQVYGSNELGQSRDIITVFYYGIDVNKPVIKMTEPASSKFKAPDDVYTIKATIENIKSKDDIKILANGYPMKSFNYSTSSNEFKIKVRLAEGLNNFELIATNETGSTSSSFEIYYNAEIPDETTGGLPEIEIINPSSVGSNNYENDLIDFKAKVNGIIGKSAIKLAVNGSENTKFSYDSETGFITDKISLIPGETTIKVTAINIFGESSNEVSILYNKQTETPKNNITFTEISNPDFDCNINITVEILGATSKNDVKLYLNQFEIRNFSFNSTTQTMKSSLYLDEGDNVIKVIFNSNGSTESEAYSVKCIPENGQGNNTDIDENTDQGGSTAAPLIDVIFPLNFSKIESKNVTLLAKVENIKSKDDIRLSVNEEPVYDFIFSETFQELKAEIELVEGQNKIIINAENPYGDFEKTVLVTFEEPLAGPPSVLINSPRNGFKTEENSVVFRASIQNIKKIEDVVVKFNGSVFSDFNYDTERGIIFGYLPVTLGQNEIFVEATNRLGTDSDKVIFNYRIEHLPAVKIISPKNGVIMGVAYAPVEAIVQNVKKSTSAVIYINGETHRSLKVENEKLTSNVPLIKGKNEIIVRVNNEFGSANDTITVLFNGRPEVPEISFLNPAKSEITVNTKDLQFEAKVTGIKHSSYVELFLNSTLISDVYYYQNENKISANLKLVKGLNIIKVIATNETGTDQQSLKVYLQ